MRLPWQRRPTALPIAPRAEREPTSKVRVVEAGEVAHARAEARREFESVLPAATTAPPSPKDLDRWYGSP